MRCFLNLTLILYSLHHAIGDKDDDNDQFEPSDGRMKYLLSFAIGAILGDIFFHLLPESYQSHLIELNDPEEVAHKKVGLSVLAGIFMFIIVEMLLEKWSKSNATIEQEIRAMLKPEQLFVKEFDDQITVSKSNKDLRKSHVNYDNKIVGLKGDSENNNNNNMTDLNCISQKVTTNNVHSLANPDLLINNNNNDGDDPTIIPQDQGHVRQRKKHSTGETKTKTISNLINGSVEIADTTSRERKISAGPISFPIIDPAGYLSLIANGFDNFTHGLAIGASFLVSSKVGLLTTFVIIIHEIPHEICDYAILVNSGFSRLDAMKAQSSVSLFGILGTATALYVKSVETLNAKTLWILPFSAGGFLYIALVNLLPEILDRQTNARNTLGQAACVILGIVFMAAVAVL